MEVTKTRFIELLPSIKKDIDDCDFIAIDTELTGLYKSQSDEHSFDTMEERYMKNRAQCSNFLITQFGLSLFKYHPDTRKYSHKEYNFYTFPAPFMHNSPDQSFACQPSSLHFLASHNFDFNKVIYQGIPYLTLSQEEEMRNLLSKKHSVERAQNLNQSPKTNGPKPIDIPDDQKEFISEIEKKVQSFMSDESQTELNLEPCNAFRRKLIFEKMQSKYPTGVDTSSKVAEDKQRYICIVKCSDKEKKERLEAKEAMDMENLDSFVGFRKVMDHLSQCKKLIIGHCMHLDIFHVIEQFFYPLPEDLREYKSMVRLTFPRLLDTKYMSNSDKLKPFFENTSLGKLLEQLKGAAFDFPDLETEKDQGYELDSDQFHEAGFDAFLAGVCFIAMSRKLGTLNNPKCEHVEISSKLLSPYVNRFYVLRHFDIGCINLSGPDPEPKRDNVFHISFPEEWKTFDLQELFLPYGDVYVNWLNSTSALVALKHPEHTIKAKTALVNKPSRLFRVVPYAEYQKWCREQFQSQKRAHLRCIPLASEFKPHGSKRRNSGSSMEASGSCAMELIPEVDENEAETIESSDMPPAKKLKPILEENETEEVSSTANVFKEDSNWLS